MESLPAAVWERGDCVGRRVAGWDLMKRRWHSIGQDGATAIHWPAKRCPGRAATLRLCSPVGRGGVREKLGGHEMEEGSDCQGLLRAEEERQRSMAGFGEGNEHLLVDLIGSCWQQPLARDWTARAIGGFGRLLLVGWCQALAKKMSSNDWLRRVATPIG
jgi:hypothetical protein